MNHLTFEDVCAGIKQAYIQLIRGKGFTYYKGTPALEEALPKAADICISLSANPEIYVQAQYLQYADPFWPNMLHTKDAKDNYKAYEQILINNALCNLKAQYATQVRYLKEAIIRAKRDPDEILADPRMGFSPWFRVYITKEPNTSIIQEYGKDAKRLLTPELIKLLEDEKLDTHRLDNI